MPKPVSDVKIFSPNMILKGMAVLLPYVLLAHPHVYATFWERRNCVRVFVWQIRIIPSAIEIPSLRGVLKRQLADVTQVERRPGQILIVFKDGS
jgi:hypothetical protein